MKYNKFAIYTLLFAAGLLAGCHKEVQQEEPQEGQEHPTFGGRHDALTLTIEATRGEVSLAGPLTKAISDEDGKITPGWAEGETVVVFNETTSQYLEGELIAQSSGVSTVLSGTVVGDVTDGDRLSLQFLSPGYDNQDGTLEYIAQNCDYALASIQVDDVQDKAIIPEESVARFESQQALVKFTLRDKDKSAAVMAKPLTLTLGMLEYWIMPKEATSELYIALPAVSRKNLRLVAYTEKEGNYAYVQRGIELEKGGYYELPLDMINATIVRSESELHEAAEKLRSPYIILGDNISTSSYVKFGETAEHTVTLDLDGYKLKRIGLSSAQTNGHVIEVFGRGTLTIVDLSPDYSGEIRGGWANHGGAICNYGNVILESGTLTDCRADMGGAIYNGGNLLIKGGTIEACIGTDAGGIYNTAGSTLTITGGTINDCLSHAGGGAFVNRGTAVVSDCFLTNNTATTRGGAIWNYGPLTLTDCEISGNLAMNYDGGALHLENGTATLSGVSITDNESLDGGGIYVKSSATLNLEDSNDISENRSTGHGGGGITNYGTVNMSGSVTILENNCETNGGGIWSNGKLNMEGDIMVSRNEIADIDGTEDDIFLTEGRIITVTGPLESTGNSIGVRMEIPGVFTSGYSQHNGDAPLPFYSSGTVDEMRLVNGEGKMLLGYYEASWNVIEKKVEYTRKTVPEDVKVYNICSAMFASGGGLSDSRWFIARGKGSTAHGLTCASGDRHIILCDGASITINEGLYVNSGSTLHIYSQSYAGRMGELISRNTMSYNPGIGGKGSEDKATGTIHIHGGNLNVSGGKMSAGIGGGSKGNSDYSRYNGGKIYIYGGAVKAVGGSEGAGIGGGYRSSGGSVTIYGGSVDAAGGEGAAGVGGGCRGDDCQVTIWDCISLMATGGECNSWDFHRGGAGIGGGYNGRNGEIRIYAGDIIAKGKDGGAGIGSGSNYSQGGAIYINGGNIEAYGADAHPKSPGTAAGAGIGTGGREMTGRDDIKAGNIYISGGNLFVQGGQGDSALGVKYGGAAGIGSGGETAGAGTIKITGGRITAYGGSFVESAFYDGAGIGGGYECPGAKVIIEGGTVTAKAGLSGAQAIGHGYDNSNSGSLELPNFYSVYAGVSPGSAHLWHRDEREKGGRQFWMRTESCSHVFEEDGHLCLYCGYSK